MINVEVEQDFVIATVITQINEIAKIMSKVEAMCKKKDKYIPYHEQKNIKDHEA